MTNLYDIDTERAVIGIVAGVSQTGLNDAKALIAKHGLNPGLFHLPSHQRVFRVCQGLLERGMPIEAVSVNAELGTAPEVEAAGGKQWVSELLEGGHVLPLGLQGHVETLRSLRLRRKVTEELRTGMAKITDRDLSPNQVLTELNANLAGITRDTNGIRQLPLFGQEVMADIENARNGTRLIAIPTGIRELDEVIGGWQRGMLNIVAGPTSAGKSALMATAIEQAAKAGTKVGVFSLEDSGSWIYYRLLSKAARIDQHKMRVSPDKLSSSEMSRVEEGAEAVNDFGHRIYVNDQPGLTPPQIAAAMTDMVVNHGVELIFVDHCGEINYGEETERLDLKIANALALFRDIAKAYDVAITCATQVTMPKDIKPGTPPEAKHMKNSSEIANKCRVLLCVGREIGSNVMKIRIAKQTLGLAGEILEVPFHGSAAMLRAADEEAMFDA